MAQVAIQQSTVADEPDHDDIKRWRSLFRYSHTQALKEIQEYRADLSRSTVSESHWEMVRTKKEAQGFNKESYEYSRSLKAPKTQKSQTSAPGGRAATYLLKLEGPLGDLEKVKSAAALKEYPPLFHGTDDVDKPTTFCRVDADTKAEILRYLSVAESPFEPTFVRYSRAKKDLSAYSAYPTLGIDTTMPQHRPNTADDVRISPAQDQYPVWYFFYGTLADPAVLGPLIGCGPLYKTAFIPGGELRTQGGKYKALVDCSDGIVHGHAFLVGDRDQEDSLCCYETDKYEVVRCVIEFEGERKVRGLTFRLVGDA